MLGDIVIGCSRGDASATPSFHTDVFANSMLMGFYCHHSKRSVATAVTITTTRHRSLAPRCGQLRATRRDGGLNSRADTLGSFGWGHARYVVTTGDRATGGLGGAFADMFYYALNINGFLCCFFKGDGALRFHASSDTTTTQATCSTCTTRSVEIQSMYWPRMCSRTLMGRGAPSVSSRAKAAMLPMLPSLFILTCAQQY